jgi:SET domain-containing protein
MLKVKTYVAPSEKHGLGLFAAEDIPAGTVVCTFNPQFDRALDADRLDLLAPPAREHVRRHGYLAGRRWWLPVDDMRFCNHSDEPNLVNCDIDLHDRAARDIAVGEELTCDYRSFDEDAERKLAN